MCACVVWEARRHGTYGEGRLVSPAVRDLSVSEGVRVQVGHESMKTKSMLRTPPLCRSHWQIAHNPTIRYTHPRSCPPGVHICVHSQSSCRRARRPATWLISLRQGKVSPPRPFCEPATVAPTPILASSQRVSVRSWRCRALPLL